jgi:hypothetical protein
LPTITIISKTTAPIVVDIVQTVGAIVELLDNLGLLQVVVVGLIGLKIFNKINNLTKGLTQLTSGTKAWSLAIYGAMTSFMFFNDILGNLDGTAKIVISSLATLLGVIVAIKGAMKGGLIGATVAGLGVGSLLAGIKGLTSIENFANGSKGEVAYTIVEINTPASQEIVAELKKIQGVFGVRTFD